MIDPITPFKTQKVLDLCSGIGGFTLAHLITSGFETVAFCEINEYCQQVLNLHFPHIPIIGDIHDITVESLARVGVREVDGIIAGLPCPPFSLAGKRLASQDRMNATCSGNSLESFAIFDQNGQLWKTFPDSSLLNRVNFSVPYCGSLPRWGSMSNGECFRQAKWEPSTNEKEFGSLLPTPKAQDGVHPGVSAYKSGQTLHLSAAVMLATPRNTDLPTQLNTGRSLNPHLVEAMIGVPQGWTDVSLPMPDLQIGWVHPQSPVSIGSVVVKLQGFRQIAKKNIANSMQNTKASENNRQSKSKL